VTHHVTRRDALRELVQDVIRRWAARGLVARAATGKFDHLWALGKAAVGAAQGVIDSCGPPRASRLVVTKHGHGDGTVHFHAHSHAGETAPHARAAHAHGHGFRWRTLLVGLMHGMAGSAALLVLAVSQASSPAVGLGYVALFGVGSMIGMGALSTVIAVPLVVSARSLTWANRGLQGAVGLATVAIGIMTVVETVLA